MTAVTLDAVPAAPSERPRVLLYGAAFAAGASTLAVLALVATYLRHRADVLGAGELLFPEGTVLPLTPGTMNLVTLGMSLVTASWIVWALRNQDRVHAYLALGLTGLLGVASIVETFYLYQQTSMPVRSGVGVLFYAVTGGHMAMSVLGLLFLAVMGLQAFGGQLTGRDAEGMSAAILYWYATVGVYVVVWYAVYITK
ncbi:MAG: cytochrome c oxidase subunit 3 [Acidimicrobiia bacterium]